VNSLAKILDTETKKEFRATVIGNLQRGGEPTSNDKLFSIQFASKAVKIFWKTILTLQLVKNIVRLFLFQLIVKLLW